MLKNKGMFFFSLLMVKFIKHILCFSNKKLYLCGLKKSVENGAMRGR